MHAWPRLCGCVMADLTCVAGEGSGRGKGLHRLGRREAAVARLQQRLTPTARLHARRLSQHCNEAACDVHDAVCMSAIEEPSFPWVRRQSAVKAVPEVSLAGLPAGPVSRCRQLCAPSFCPPWARAGARSRRRAQGLSFLHRAHHYGPQWSYLHLTRPGHWRAAAGRFWGTAPAAWAACACCASPAEVREGSQESCGSGSLHTAT